MNLAGLFFTTMMKEIQASGTKSEVMGVDPIDSRRLNAFVHLAKIGNFRKASVKLHLTPSAISHAIKTLENELNVVLFDRTTTRVQMTRAGEVLLTHAQHILEAMNVARDELRQLDDWKGGRLRIATTASACHYFLPPVLLEFRECFPECALQVRAADTAEAVELLERGEVDLVLGIVDEAPEMVNSRELFQDEIRFYISARHHLADKLELTAEDIRQLQFIVYNFTSPASQQIMTQLRGQGVPEGQITPIGNIEGMKEMAKVGLGVAALPRWVAARSVDRGELSEVRFVGPAVKRHWVAMWLPHRTPNLMGQTLLDLASTASEQFDLTGMIA
jgi:LysR family transcriptional regulator, low CO2-responsive transcriptional regulator